VGTFSSRDVTSEGVFGVEVRIATADDPSYQAVVQFGYGEICSSKGSSDCFRLSNLYVVEAAFDWKHVPEPNTAALRFVIPGPGPFAGSVEGVVSHEALSGTFTPDEGAPMHLALKRGVPWSER
jgi:hypothetical protein